MLRNPHGQFFGHTPAGVDTKMNPVERKISGIGLGSKMPSARPQQQRLPGMNFKLLGALLHRQNAAPDIDQLVGIHDAVGMDSLAARHEQSGVTGVQRGKSSQSKRGCAGHGRASKSELSRFYTVPASYAIVNSSYINSSSESKPNDFWRNNMPATAPARPAPVSFSKVTV